MRRETVAHSKELSFSFGNFCNRLKHFRSYGLIMGVNQSARSKHHIKDDEEVNFDHFQILRAIGKGSFGKVCIVQKKDTGQMYAMKYMSKSACLERDALRNVLREIEILTQLEHPFLVNLWFSFHDEEDMFLVQDLLLGGDLRYHLTQNVQFQIDAVKLYICELAMALDYLQSKRIIHRDIKPDNILLDEEGHAHLTDFNVATVLEENKRYASALSGTKPYMAPEVFACAADEIPGYDFAVDWWSLGIVAYELCFGCRPHDIHSQTPNKEIRAMLLKEPEWPPTWPPNFVSLVKQLLSPSPSGRIQNLIMLKSLPFMQDSNWSEILDKNTSPLFLPPKGHLNCDPTFELEEMIVESKPLHKKKKRLAKQRSLRELQTPPSTAALIEQESNLDPLAEEFTTFNRQKELDRLERERKEQEWEEELLRAMEASEFPSSSKAVAARGFRRLPSDLSLPTTIEEPGPDPTNVGGMGGCEGAVGGSVGNVAGGGSVGDVGSVGNKGSTSRLPDLLDPCTMKKTHTPSPSMAENKKVAWAKNRSATVPEGAKLWSKFRKP